MPSELVRAAVAACGEAIGRNSFGLRDRDAIADAVQDCLVRVFLWWRGETREVGVDEIRAIAFGVAKRMKLERWRGTSERNNADDLESQRAIDQAHQAAVEEERSYASPILTNAMISAIRGRMPTLHYKLLVQRVLNGWSFARIASAESIPESTVKRRYREAIEIVVESLREQALSDERLAAELRRVAGEG